MASMIDVAEVGCARVEEAADIAEIVNCAYQGGDGLTAGWTGVAHLLGGSRVTVDQVAAWIVADPLSMLVLRDCGEVVGSVHLTHLRPYVGEIGLLAIRPSRQDGGFGRALLAAAERHLVDHWDCRIAELTVLSPRPELESWYERRGYRPTGRRRPLSPDGEGYGEPMRPALELVEYSRTIA
jgi:ribosomal protein S18 acetylase RimI-like enzyme